MRKSKEKSMSLIHNISGRRDISERDLGPEEGNLGKSRIRVEEEKKVERDRQDKKGGRNARASQSNEGLFTKENSSWEKNPSETHGSLPRPDNVSKGEQRDTNRPETHKNLMYGYSIAEVYV